LHSAALNPAQDLSELYSLLSKRLEANVRLGVAAPDAVVEDACQFAWSRLVSHASHVRRDAVMAWLIRTAVREAVRVVKRSAREVPLDHRLLEGPEAPDPHELLEARERLSVMGELPARQQRLLWLHAIGLSYAEMARHERCSRRTVERQLLRAKRSVRAAASE
jgi:RNA polymerase sigma factor (sigma-70 family)